MMTLNHRYKAWILLEADSPLSIGSGKEGLTTDRLVARDAAGLPYIPGTGLTGALKDSLNKSLGRDTILSVFGFSEKDLIVEEKKERKKTNKPVSIGGRLIVNSAHLLASDGTSALEGIPTINEEDNYYKHFTSLPIRDHARINDRGVTTHSGKFDEQICYKGVRFMGSLELLGTDSDEGIWEIILAQLKSPVFRIGGGTRKGFGKLKIIKIQTICYNLTDEKERKAYLNDDNSLQPPSATKDIDLPGPESTKYITYKISLTPRDFFIFGAGYGDEEADDVYKTEYYFDWQTGKPELSEEKILIPATSVKGALRHRLAFNYNKETGLCIDINDQEQLNVNLEKRLEELEELAKVPEGLSSNDPWWDDAIQKLQSASYETTGAKKGSEKETDPTAQNEAVKKIFGYATEHGEGTEAEGQKGRVLISDVYLNKAKEKVFDHVRIDRFTGGASDGALYQEKTVAGSHTFDLEIMVESSVLDEPQIKNAWHKTLSDLREGQLPLGGKTTKGHGFFTGTCNINLTNDEQ